MSGFNALALFAVSQVRVGFRDHNGNPLTILGTGFWIQDRANWWFVTNRHNVDSKLKLGPDSKYVLETVELLLRTEMTPLSVAPGTSFIPIRNLHEALRLHATADVAVFRNPLTAVGDKVVSHSGFKIEDIADEKFLADSALPMDFASFVGFPGKDGKGWWDQRWDLPIARTANIASLPRTPFSHEDIKTSDTVLVSGLSFNGSSGGPVLLHEKGVSLQLPDIYKVSGGGYVPPKLVGIMSGHWWDEQHSPQMFFHSGLSYFTRSTAILELLK